jgi:hypothetical protein
MSCQKTIRTSIRLGIRGQLRCTYWNQLLQMRPSFNNPAELYYLPLTHMCICTVQYCTVLCLHSTSQTVGMAPPDGSSRTDTTTACPQRAVGTQQHQLHTPCQHVATTACPRSAKSCWRTTASTTTHTTCHTCLLSPGCSQIGIQTLCTPVPVACGNIRLARMPAAAQRADLAQHWPPTHFKSLMLPPAASRSCCLTLGIALATKQLQRPPHLWLNSMSHASLLPGVQAPIVTPPLLQWPLR